MYISEQLAFMDTQLEDSGDANWTESQKLRALEAAGSFIANILDNHYLTELQDVKTALAVTSGKALLSGLAYEVAKGEDGIHQVEDATRGRMMRKLSISDARKQESALLGATLFNPQCFVYQNRIWVFPITITSINVYYLRIPSVIRGTLTYGVASPQSGSIFAGADDQDLSAVNDYYNGAVIWESVDNNYHIVTDYTGATREFTITPAKSSGNYGTGTFKFLTDPFNNLGLSGVRSELNSSLHMIQAWLGAAYCFIASRDFDRAKAVSEWPLNEINIMNQKYDKKPVNFTDLGIGTDQKGR